MYLHELCDPKRNVVVHNEVTGHTVVVTPQNAVFECENTDELTHMCTAFGCLFDGNWRKASAHEIHLLRTTDPGPRILKLTWAEPEKAPPGWPLRRVK